MAQEYLPAPSNVRLADLMKEHNISQPETSCQGLFNQIHKKATKKCQEADFSS